MWLHNCYAQFQARPDPVFCSVLIAHQNLTYFGPGLQAQKMKHLNITEEWGNQAPVGLLPWSICTLKARALFPALSKSSNLPSESKITGLILSKTTPRLSPTSPTFRYQTVRLQNFQQRIIMNAHIVLRMRTTLLCDVREAPLIFRHTLGLNRIEIDRAVLGIMGQKEPKSFVCS